MQSIKLPGEQTGRWEAGRQVDGLVGERQAGTWMDGQS